MDSRFSVRLVLIATLLGVTLPVLSLLIWSFAPAWPWPHLWPAQMDLQAWEYILSPDSGVLRSVWTSVVLGLAVTATCMAVGIPAGLALGRYAFRGRAAVEVLLLLPLLAPPMAWSTGVHFLFIRLGLTDSFTGVWLSHLVPTLPYMVRAVAAATSTLGVRVEEVGRVLGARPWQVFRHITLPRISPAVLAGSILVFLVSFSQYLLTFFIGGGAVLTFPMILMPFLTGSERSLAAALSILFVLVGILFLWLADSLMRRTAQKVWFHI